jgi:hypothetical protein
MSAVKLKRFPPSFLPSFPLYLILLSRSEDFFVAEWIKLCGWAAGRWRPFFSFLFFLLLFLLHLAHVSRKTAAEKEKRDRERARKKSFFLALRTLYRSS